ncbi:MAG: hypothetical protein ACYC8T_33940 [Myxococcaceae bacterium]
MAVNPLRLALSLFIVAAVAAGCRCDDTLGGVEAGFRVDGSRVDFGRALEGTQVAQEVVLHATGRADLTVETSTQEPFAVAESVTVPGGSEIALPVLFIAGSTRASGTLLLSANNKTVTVTLTGEGVRALDCRPSAACRVSRFDLASNACIESVAADGAACTPGSDCLENGQCRAGACIGAPRSCDDANKCTADACAESVGCVHSAVSCPMPSKPCHVPTCDPNTGCGEAAASDGTPCGSVDCINANLCFMGQCRKVPTPDNFVCLPRTPCQGEGHCRNQKCERPLPTEMSPAWLVPMEQAPSPGSALIALEGNLFFEVCDGGCQLVSYTGSGFQRFSTPHPDTEARTVAAASSHGVVVLAASALEAFAPTTGAPLWSLPFAQLEPPPGADGGEAVCSGDRVAFTSTGELVAALSWRPGRADGGADAGGDGGADDGGAADAGAADGGEVDGGEVDGGEVDGGRALLPGLQTLLRVSPDGGVTPGQTVRGAATESRVALSALDELYLYDPSGALSRGSYSSDAGYLLDDWMPHTGVASLSAGGGRVLAGALHLLDADGGARIAGIATGLDGGVLRLLPGPSLLAQGKGYAFSRACLPPWGPPCAPEVEATFLNSYSLADGSPLWQSKILPEGAWGRLDEAALVSIGGGVATLTEVELDGGRVAHVQLFAGGNRLFVCPLAPGATLGPAVFDHGFVYVLVERAGAWNLEAYDLAGLPLESSGWPQSNGVSGTRRAR